MAATVVSVPRLVRVLVDPPERRTPLPVPAPPETNWLAAIVTLITPPRPVLSTDCANMADASSPVTPILAWSSIVTAPAVPAPPALPANGPVVGRVTANRPPPTMPPPPATDCATIPWAPLPLVTRSAWLVTLTSPPLPMPGPALACTCVFTAIPLASNPTKRPPPPPIDCATKACALIPLVIILPCEASETRPPLPVVPVEPPRVIGPLPDTP